MQLKVKRTNTNKFFCTGSAAAASAVVFVLHKPGLFPHASPSDWEDGGSMARQHYRSGQGTELSPGLLIGGEGPQGFKSKQKKWCGVLSCLPKALVPNEREKTWVDWALNVAHHQDSPAIDAKDSSPVSTIYSRFISLATHSQSLDMWVSTSVCKTVKIPI